VTLITAPNGVFPSHFTGRTQRDGRFVISAERGEYTMHVDGVWVCPNVVQKIDARNQDRIELGDVVVEEIAAPIIDAPPNISMKPLLMILQPIAPKSPPETPPVPPIPQSTQPKKK
jgi:hypothetical protein